MIDPTAAPAVGPDGFPVSAWSPPPETLAAMAQLPAAAPAAPAAPVVPAAPQPVPAPAPKRVPVVRDLTGRPLVELHDLAWPREVDGVEIRQVEMRRLSTGQIDAFVDAEVEARKAGQAASRLFPIYYRTDGARLSDDEWDALDPDDTDALGAKGDRFLPARYRTTKAPAASPPGASGSTGSSSAA